MTAAVVALVAVGALVYVMAPLRRGLVGGREPEVSPRAEQAHARKRAALGAIVDLEDERDAGKLSEADFHKLLLEYECEALDAMRELDRLRAPEQPDPLEEEIAAMRMRVNCPSCGEARNLDQPCPRCGA
jgi:hypothetical protein